MIRIDTGLCPGEFVLSVDSEQDCMLFFLLDYEDVEFKIYGTACIENGGTS